MEIFSKHEMNVVCVFLCLQPFTGFLLQPLHFICRSVASKATSTVVNLSYESIYVFCCWLVPFTIHAGKTWWNNAIFTIPKSPLL